MAVGAENVALAPVNGAENDTVSSDTVDIAVLVFQGGLQWYGEGRTERGGLRRTASCSQRGGAGTHWRGVRQAEGSVEPAGDSCGDGVGSARDSIGGCCNLSHAGGGIGIDDGS